MRENGLRESDRAKGTWEDVVLELTKKSMSDDIEIYVNEIQIDRHMVFQARW